MLYELILLTIPMSIIILLLTFYGITTATNIFHRIMILLLFVFGLGVGFSSFVRLLSLPKPAKIEWLYTNIDEVEVLAADIKSNEKLYIWMRIPGVHEPRYYIFDWDEQRARQMQQALNKKARKGGKGKIKMKNPFGPKRDFSLEDREPEIKFEPIPRQLPLKPYEPEG